MHLDLAPYILYHCDNQKIRFLADTSFPKGGVADKAAGGP